METLSKLPVYGWVFLTLIVAILSTAIGLILYKIVKVNGLSIKAGDKEINLSSRNASIVKVVTEYADFKYKLNDELTEAKKDLHDKAKWTTNMHLEQYLNRLTSEYIPQLKRTNTVAREITVSIFPMLMELVRSRLFAFAMTIYEKNHLFDKTDEELHELAKINYGRISDIFREFVSINWYEFLAPYKGLHDACTGLEQFAEGIMYSTLVMYREYSKIKKEMADLITEVDTVIRTKVQADGRMPVNYLTVANNFYNSNSGINKALIDTFLEDAKS